MKRAPVYLKGEVVAHTLLDDKDYERFRDIYFGFYRFGTKPRVHVTINGQQRDLAWWILQPRAGCYVDHINRDCLDNRRENLREATKAQNAYNSPGPQRGTSRFKGVSWFPHDKRRRRWRAVIVKDGKQHHLGYFKTEEDAAQAWNEAARKLHGEFAWQNPFEA